MLNIPNLLSALRIILTPFVLYLYSSQESQYQILGIIVFFIASFTDWYDGYYARKHNIVTRLGQFLDPLADKILNLSVSLIFVHKGYIFYWVFYSIAIRDLLVTILRLFALQKNQPVVTSYLAKWKTAIYMFLLFFIMITELLLNFDYTLEWSLYKSNITVLGILWIITAVLSIYTGIVYCIDNRSHIVQVWRAIMKFLKIY